jgi:uncharacterized membrane protein (DUF485 family)
MAAATGGAAAQGPSGGGTGGPASHQDVDWEAIERSPEFRELVSKKRAFVVPATIFFLAWYLGFILLAGYAPDFMGSEFLADGLTVGYVLAVTQFLMVWGLAWAYVRRADKVFDPLSEAVVERSRQGASAAQDPVQGPATGAGPRPTGEVAPR